MELADLTRGMRKNVFLEPDFFFSHCSHETQTSPALQKKKSGSNVFFSELEQLFFCRALFQLSFLAILAFFVVDCLIFGKAAKDCIALSAARWGKASGCGFDAGAALFTKLLGKQCSRPDWKQSKHVRKKNNFSELEQLIFCKTSVFWKLLY